MGPQREEGPGSIALTLECFLYVEAQLRDMRTHLKKQARAGGVGEAILQGYKAQC